MAFVIDPKLHLGVGQQDSPLGGHLIAAGVRVFAQAAAGQVGAGYAFDWEHLEAPHEDRAPLDGGGNVGGHDVVGHEISELVEPPERQLGQHDTLVRNGAIEHEVEGGEPVGGNEQEVVGVGGAVGLAGGVEVADLAGVDVDVAGEVDRGGVHRRDPEPGRWTSPSSAAWAMSLR